jgi:hypothetical protein
MTEPKTDTKAEPARPSKAAQAEAATTAAATLAWQEAGVEDPMQAAALVSAMAAAKAAS